MPRAVTICNYLWPIVTNFDHFCDWNMTNFRNILHIIPFRNRRWSNNALNWSLACITRGYWWANGETTFCRFRCFYIKKEFVAIISYWLQEGCLDFGWSQPFIYLDYCKASYWTMFLWLDYQSCRCRACSQVVGNRVCFFFSHWILSCRTRKIVETKAPHHFISGQQKIIVLQEELWVHKPIRILQILFVILTPLTLIL